MPPDHHDAWENEVRSVYTDGTVSVITPTWTKLIDFEHTLLGSRGLMHARSAQLG